MILVFLNKLNERTQDSVLRIYSSQCLASFAKICPVPKLGHKELKSLPTLVTPNLNKISVSKN